MITSLGSDQNANMMSLLGLSKQWKELVGKAKAKQLKPDEYTGGTFTITNLGMFGELELRSVDRSIARGLFSSCVCEELTPFLRVATDFSVDCCCCCCACDLFFVRGCCEEYVQRGCCEEYVQR